MTDPGDDSWDIDVFVEGSTVETVVLRFHADALPAILNSLLTDTDESHVRRALAYVVDRQGIDPATLRTDE